MTVASNGATTGLPAGLRRLVEEVRAASPLTPASTRELLAGAALTADDLAPWADYDHPAADSYGRKLVHDGGSFELMVMSWAPGDMAAIHDHGYTQWGAVRLFGDAEHATFKIDRDGAGEERLLTTDRRVFESGSVVGVGNDLIHQMGNPGDEAFLSLHLYGCDGREGGITSEARVYELEEGSIQRVDGGVFFALPEEQVLRREEGPGTDFTTRLRHTTELLRRLFTINSTLSRRGFQSPREARLGRRLLEAEGWEGGVDEIAEVLDGGSSALSKPAAVAIDLRAAADLKHTMIEAGLAAGGFSPYGARLEEISGFEDPERVVTSYLDLLDTAIGVN